MKDCQRGRQISFLLLVTGTVEVQLLLHAPVLLHDTPLPALLVLLCEKVTELGGIDLAGQISELVVRRTM